MTSNETLNKEEENITNIKKSKLLYALHAVVPMGLVALSTAGVIVSSLQSNTSATLSAVDTGSNITTYNLTTEYSNRDLFIELLNLNNKSDQNVLMIIIQVINFLFAILTFVYSKMMNNEQHKLGNDNIRVKSEKNTLLEQLTNITLSLSQPASARKELVFTTFPDILNATSPAYANSVPSIVTPTEDEGVLHTGRSNSTVYIRPYVHNAEPYN